MCVLQEQRAKYLSDIETMLIVALDADYDWVAPKRIDYRGKLVPHASSGLVYANAKPKKMYTFDAMDETRQGFICHPDLLIAHPKELLGDRTELIHVAGDKITWRCYIRMERQPKGVASVGAVDAWYEVHVRNIALSGEPIDYVRDVAAFNRKGFPVPTKLKGAISIDMEHAECAFATAHVVDDSHRSDALLAEVSEKNSIRFSVPSSSYKEFFKLREAPRRTGTGRRNPILHWCSKHMRTRGGNTFEVRGHRKGVESVTIDRLNLTLQPAPCWK